MRNNSALNARLQKLGLSHNESSIFLSLLDSPKTPVEVSRVTGIARSNVYRIVDDLYGKGLLHEQTTDGGKLLAAAEPTALELLVLEQERIAEDHRASFGQLLPLLATMTAQKETFSIQTYRGMGGVKQMLWNELRSKEILIFCAGPLDLGTGRRWAEKYRGEIIARNISQRALENPRPLSITSNQFRYEEHYNVRFLPRETLHIEPEISIHDDTISVYNSWIHDAQVGTEIKNPFLAAFMRQIFEHYWQLAGE